MELRSLTRRDRDAYLAATRARYLKVAGRWRDHEHWANYAE